RHRPLRGGRRPDHPRQAPDASDRPRAPGLALPPVRHDAGSRLLRGLRRGLLPPVPDGGQAAEGPPPLPNAEINPFSVSSATVSVVHCTEMDRLPVGAPPDAALDPDLGG